MISIHRVIALLRQELPSLIAPAIELNSTGGWFKYGPTGHRAVVAFLTPPGTTDEMAAAAIKQLLVENGVKP